MNNCYGSTCMPRGFYTKEEKIDSLKKYKEALDKESAGVSEKIAMLEKQE